MAGLTHGFANTEDYPLTYRGNVFTVRRAGVRDGEFYAELDPPDDTVFNVIRDNVLSEDLKTVSWDQVQDTLNGM